MLRSLLAESQPLTVFFAFLIAFRLQSFDWISPVGNRNEFRPEGNIASETNDRNLPKQQTQQMNLYYSKGQT